MKILAAILLVLFASFVGSIGIWKAIHARQVSAAKSTKYLKDWSPAAAATYLDAREVWWQKWPPAQIDHGTVCISCHTVLPYAFVRPALRQQLGESELTAPETAMLASIEKRVNNWSQVTPYYTDAANGPDKSAQSRATEAVLNVVILSTYDAIDGQIAPVTQSAFGDAWALQDSVGENAGSWDWQDFHLAPWESPESRYQGAALMAVALGNTSGVYAAEPEIREHLNRLQSYLRRHYATQPLMSQLYVLWASGQMPGLLNEGDRKRLIGRIENLQLHDGGWALASLDQQPGLRRYLVDHWRQMSNTAESDGCATGLIVLALEKAGESQQNATLNRGLRWLQQHQDADGGWQAYSLNGIRDPESDIGEFMNDAATGYAALALENAPHEALNYVKQ